MHSIFLNSYAILAQIQYWFHKKMKLRIEFNIVRALLNCCQLHVPTLGPNSELVMTLLILYSQFPLDT